MKNKNSYYSKSDYLSSSTTEESLLDWVASCESHLDRCHRVPYLLECELISSAQQSQAVIQDVTYRELFLPASESKRASIERNFKREVAEADARLQSFANPKRKARSRARKAFHRSVEAAEQKRSAALSKKRRDDCNNWGGDAARLEHVCCRISKHAPPDKIAAIVELHKEAIQFDEYVATLADDVRHQSLLHEARSRHQTVLSEIRRLELKQGCKLKSRLVIIPRGSPTY